MRITRKHLEAKVVTLNRITGSPETYWDKEAGKANLGNWHLDSMNPGDGRTYALERVINESGGVSRPTSSRRMSGKEMAVHLDGVIAGYELAKVAMPSC